MSLERWHACKHLSIQSLSHSHLASFFHFFLSFFLIHSLTQDQWCWTLPLTLTCIRDARSTQRSSRPIHLHFSNSLGCRPSSTTVLEMDVTFERMSSFVHCVTFKGAIYRLHQCQRKPHKLRYPLRHLIMLSLFFLLQNCRSRTIYTNRNAPRTWTSMEETSLCEARIS